MRHGVVHAMLQGIDHNTPRGRFHGLVHSGVLDAKGISMVTLRVEGEDVSLLLGPGVSLEPGDFVIASHLGNGAVTFHHVEREQTGSVVIYSDGTPE